MSESKVQTIFGDKGILLTDWQVEQFEKYYELLIKWNTKINLTAITEYEDVIWKHFFDSASIMFHVKHLSDCETIRLLDLGTGAGFPGMVLAILFPNWRITLVDSLQKRIDFLKIVVRELGLEHVELYHGRAEDYGRDGQFREQFDYVVSRAVAELPMLLEYCVPFVKMNGFFVSYKGRRYAEEMEQSRNSLSELGCSVETVEPYSLGDGEERFLLFIRKNESTKEKYPRKPGKIKKQPL